MKGKYCRWVLFNDNGQVEQYTVWFHLMTLEVSTIQKFTKSLREKNVKYDIQFKEVV